VAESHTPNIIDIEASGLGPGSYPIEIGVSMADGGAHCFLIQPYDDWTHWDEQAENLHRLKRDTIVRFGMDGGYVARQLNKYLQGQTVYSDAWENASNWLALLFERAGMVQDFKLEQLDKITTDEQRQHWDKMRDQVTDELGLKRHRASADARIIQMTWMQTYKMKQAASM
jgi:hypothetical protein